MDIVHYTLTLYSWLLWPTHCGQCVDRNDACRSAAYHSLTACRARRCNAMRHRDRRRRRVGVDVLALVSCCYCCCGCRLIFAPTDSCWQYNLVHAVRQCVCMFCRSSQDNAEWRDLGQWKQFVDASDFEWRRHFNRQWRLSDTSSLCENVLCELIW